MEKPPLLPGRGNASPAAILEKRDGTCNGGAPEHSRGPLPTIPLYGRITASQRVPTPVTVFSTGREAGQGRAHTGLKKEDTAAPTGLKKEDTAAPLV